jgi:hypothetical protein
MRKFLLLSIAGVAVLLLPFTLMACSKDTPATPISQEAAPPPAYRESMRNRIVEWENDSRLKWGQQDEEMVATIMNSDPTYDLAVGAFLSGAIKTNALSPVEALKRMDEWQKRWPDRTETWQVTRDMVNRLKAERGG